MPKAQEYVLIQNNGAAPVEGYTVLGYSSTRNCGVEGVIGQFGSGSKHAVNLCLRNGLAVWVYCGNTRLEFGLEEEVVSDGLTEETVHHVTYRKNNNEYKRAGWVLDYGVLDWDNIGMALREFISNAIDRTLRESGSLQDSNHMSVKIVDESDRRAKAGCTRIYVALNDEVREYFGQLGKRFLHFSDTPTNAKPGLLPKAGRNLSGGKGAVIYREGVYIRELDGEPSVFDYNFSADELKIDECRNSSDYAVRAACARKLGSAEADVLSKIFQNEMVGEKTFESGLDQSYIFGDVYAEPNDTQKETWTRAWEAAAGPNAVVCDSPFTHDFVSKKGHTARLIPTPWASSLGKIVKSAGQVLNDNERRGRTALDATPFAKAAVSWAWDLFDLANLIGDLEKPEVFCFQQISSAGATVNGFQDEEGVHIHVDIANDGLNNELKKTALEEVTHYVTGAGDMSRDFQNCLLDALVALA